MPSTYIEYPRTTEPGDSTTVWNAKNQSALESIVTQFTDSGWSADPRHPYTKLRTTTDMFGFSPGNELFYAVFPPGWIAGVTGNANLVVNAVPSGYVPPTGYTLFAVTGSVDKTINHPSIVDAYVAQGSFSPCPISTDPADPDPNTYIQADDKVFELGFDTPAIGLQLNTTQVPFGGGGMALECAPNVIGPGVGDDNFISMFLGRDVVSGIEPFKPFVFFCKEVGVQPIVESMEVGDDRSLSVTLLFTKSDFIIAATANMALMAQVSDGFNGQFNTAALDLPVEQAGIVEAVFGSATPTSGAGVQGLRTGGEVQGFMFMRVNGGMPYIAEGSSKAPRVMMLWGPSGEWENGLGQISEPWMGFEPETLVPIAPILGRMPSILMVNKQFVAADTPIFPFDNFGWRIWGNNVTRNIAGQLGTVAVQDPSPVVPPGCP